MTALLLWSWSFHLNWNLKILQSSTPHHEAICAWPQKENQATLIRKYRGCCSLRLCLKIEEKPKQPPVSIQQSTLCFTMKPTVMEAACETFESTRGSSEAVVWNPMSNHRAELKHEPIVAQCSQLSQYQCFGSGSGLDTDTIGSVDTDPDSEYGSGSATRRAKMTHKNWKKLRSFMFFSAGCSLLRADWILNQFFEIPLSLSASFISFRKSPFKSLTIWGQLFMMTTVSVGFTLPVVSVLDPDSDELKLGIRNTVTNPEKPKKSVPQNRKS